MDSDLDHILPVLDQLGIEYKQEVQRARILCPWHKDSEPSFYIFDDNHCFCFGCQKRCWHDELIAKLAECSVIEAKKKLGIYDPTQEYVPAEPRAKVDKYDFAEPPKDCTSAWEKLSDEMPQQMIDFLDKKAIREVAYNDGLWRWMPRGCFKCWENREGICIPYFDPDLNICTYRLRMWDRRREKFSHPIAPAGVPLQACYYVCNTKDPVYFAEGESDSISLVSCGKNVICLPGVGAHRQLNSAIVQCFEWGIPKFIFCGDNDEAGQKFNKYAEKATLDLGLGIYKPIIEFLKLPDEYNLQSDGSYKRKDINDFLVEGRLKQILDPEKQQKTVKLTDILGKYEEMSMEEDIFK